MLKLEGKKFAYWMWQFTGWAGFVIHQFILLIGMKQDASLKSNLDFFIIALCGILVTHLYRLALKNVNIIGLPWRIQLPLLFLCLILLSVIMIFSTVFAAFITRDRVGFKINTDTIAQLVDWMPILAIWMLCYHIYKLFERKLSEEREKLNALVEKKGYELELLHAQLNPHFLFNSLNSIRALINTNPTSAREAATLLSVLLRYVLNYEKLQTIPLRHEMEMVHAYLRLEKIRFDERLSYTVKQQDGTDSVLIPPVVLLTITENAVKHGINQSDTGGIINFEIVLNNLNLEVSVTNTGQVLNTEETSNGIGMDNTKKRLDIIYNGEASLFLDNLDKRHVITKITIPLKKVEQIRPTRSIFDK